MLKMTTGDPFDDTTPYVGWVDNINNLRVEDLREVYAAVRLAAEDMIAMLPEALRNDAAINFHEAFSARLQESRKSVTEFSTPVYAEKPAKVAA
jgi:hypothetical protein